MALTISKLKMWKDPGYTRGCLEVPPAGSKKLPATPDYVLPVGETLRPHKATTLTELHLPISYSQVFDMSYLYIEASDGAGTVKLFGWIDSIEQRSTSADGVSINWTVDWWRSYSGAVTFGSGTIRRCNDASLKRPYKAEPRKWKVKYKEKLIDWSGKAYPYSVILICSETVGTDTIIRTYFWNCSLNSSFSIIVGGVTYYGLTLNDVLEGKVDEMLGIDPQAIMGIYVVPIQPWPPNTAYVKLHGTHYAYYHPDNITLSRYTGTFVNTYSSDDNLRTVIMDPSGGIVYTLPWGFSINACVTAIDVGTVGVNITGSLRMSTDTDSPPDRFADGKGFTLPALTLPWNSNGYSSYNYSGQRETEMWQRQVETNQKAISGATAAGVEGTGAALVSMVPFVGPILGGMSGVSAASKGIQAGTDYLLETFVFNDELQAVQDQLHSNQTPVILGSAGGMVFTDDNVVPSTWYIIQLEADDVSAAEYSNNVSINGYETDHPVSSVSSFITTGGPLQIINLNLTGNAPPQAKQMIKDRLSSGVQIKENNPSGVAP